MLFYAYYLYVSLINKRFLILLMWSIFYLWLLFMNLYVWNRKMKHCPNFNNEYFIVCLMFLIILYN